MKSLKTLLCAACLVGILTSVGNAQNINTVAGEATIPNTVKAVTLSNTSIKGMLQDFGKEQLAKDSTKKSINLQSTKDLVAAIDQMGVSYDLYQLQGSDKTGQKDAAIIAVDVKAAIQALKLDASKEPMVAMAMQTLQNGELDPITEQLMLTAVNSQLPTGTKTFDLTRPLPKDLETKSQTMYRAIGSDLTNTNQITVQDVKPLTKLNGTKYNTYTISGRVIGNNGGMLQPYYANAAFVMNPNHPTLYVALTSDVQHSYFEPILNNFYKSIK